jgi:hypothetical protein
MKRGDLHPWVRVYQVNLVSFPAKIPVTFAGVVGDGQREPFNNCEIPRAESASNPG